MCLDYSLSGLDDKFLSMFERLFSMSCRFLALSLLNSYFRLLDLLLSCSVSFDGFLVSNLSLFHNLLDFLGGLLLEMGGMFLGLSNLGVSLSPCLVSLSFFKQFLGMGGVLSSGLQVLFHLLKSG